MTAVAITLGVAAIGWTVAIVLLVRELVESRKSDRASFAAEVEATRERIAVEAQRDDAIADHAREAQAHDQTIKALETAQRGLAIARKELIKHAEREILAADPADLARRVDELLSAPILDADASDGTPEAAGDDRGDTEPTAVRAPPAAPAGSAGRSAAG